MKDIETRADIELFMREFYGRLLADPAINYMFTDVAKIDLEEHLPHLADFWEQTLFYKGNYRKNVLQIHQELNDKETITDLHFEIWLSHFTTTADLLFCGNNTEKIKTRALSIASVIKIKIFN
ncbi:group III truncated hemoglobin [Flavobacterium salilacus subsp. salilacus]|uniref:group III truncated hemoglobin n=1 Tax=Flavobacterium TaxID=237 RepID=UPI001074B53A|nr:MULTISPECIES: group III truncated hemoglobin [Flavobacterium]KAF2519608.1 group III truncated hemoglobin [Flavobacterium salilacus subsp. salilacus]MBE1614490.1 group III truncated hemoglobin [Flavobacterium sp. SaA2.13]